MSGNILVYNKAFFGKTTALKIQYNSSLKAIFFHVGKKEGDGWKWLKGKFSDVELSQIYHVLIGKIDKVAFFHNYKEAKQQIWVNRMKDVVFFKISVISKSLNSGEQEVLRILIEDIIVRYNREVEHATNTF